LYGSWAAEQTPLIASTGRHVDDIRIIVDEVADRYGSPEIRLAFPSQSVASCQPIGQFVLRSDEAIRQSKASSHGLSRQLNGGE
jgi:hypothetical protein